MNTFHGIQFQPESPTGRARQVTYTLELCSFCSCTGRKGTPLLSHPALRFEAKLCHSSQGLAHHLGRKVPASTPLGRCRPRADLQPLRTAGSLLPDFTNSGSHPWLRRTPTFKAPDPFKKLDFKGTPVCKCRGRGGAVQLPISTDPVPGRALSPDLEPPPFLTVGITEARRREEMAVAAWERRSPGTDQHHSSH